MGNEVKAEVPTETKNTERRLKIVAIIFGISLIIVLSLIKYLTPSFPWVWVIIIGGFILLCSLITYFAFSIKRKLFEKEEKIKQLEKLPPCISKEDAIAIAERELATPEWANHIKKHRNQASGDYGKHPQNYIFVFEVDTLYENALDKKKTLLIFINGNFPNRTNIKPLPCNITRVANMMCSNPEVEPDIEETQEENPLTGTKKVTKKIIQQKDKEKVEEKKEDLE